MPQYISEDNTMMYNRWVQGIATRDLNGKPILMTDLKTVNNSQNYTNSDIGEPNIQIPKVLPFPLSTIYDDIAGFLIDYSNIQEKLHKSLQNPVNNDVEQQKIKEVIQIFKQVESIIKQAVNRFDKEEKESKEVE